MVLTVQQTMVIPQLQSIDKVIDVPVLLVQQIPGAVCEETVAIPQLQLVFFPGQGRSQLVVVQRQCRLVQTSENCAGPQLQFIKIVDISFVLQRLISLVLVDHGDSTVAVLGQGDR